MEQSLTKLASRSKFEILLWFFFFFLTNKEITTYIINTFLWENRLLSLVSPHLVLLSQQGHFGIKKSNSLTDGCLPWLTEIAISGLSLTTTATPNVTFIAFATQSCLIWLPVTSNFKEGIYLIGFNSAWELFFSIAIYLIVPIQRIISSTRASCSSPCFRNVQVILNLILYLWTYSQQIITPSIDCFLLCTVNTSHLISNVMLLRILGVGSRVTVNLERKNLRPRVDNLGYVT